MSGPVVVRPFKLSLVNQTTGQSRLLTVKPSDGIDNVGVQGVLIASADLDDVGQWNLADASHVSAVNTQADCTAWDGYANLAWFVQGCLRDLDPGNAEHAEHAKHAMRVVLSSSLCGEDPALVIEGTLDGKHWGSWYQTSAADGGEAKRNWLIGLYQSVKRAMLRGADALGIGTSTGRSLLYPRLGDLATG